ncbi:MAG: DUF4105 domain-containing protein [Prevotella sp.]|nr:DUF4105 domain-containing protein [Prevotella sp.]
MNLKNAFLVLIILTISSIGKISAQLVPYPPVTADRSQKIDSVEVSLLTCSPHEEVYSLYGHTALRWHESWEGGQDIAFNWGVFNFEQPYFVARFVFGLTDYELGPIPFDAFCEYYKEWGSSVTEQVINLTSDEKRQLQQLLATNLLPENRVYRYNYFYDNCSTRPRDIVENAIEGRIIYNVREDYHPSYREMVHECTRNHAWGAFGNDMLLGLKADRPTTREEQEFLPANLLYDFDHAQIVTADGKYRPLVAQRRVVVPPGVQLVERDFPLTPFQCAICLLVLTIIICFLEWRRGKTFKWFDVILMLLQATAGIILTLMVFSQHPTVSVNLQIFLFNPLPILFLYSVIRRRPTRWWTVLAVLLLLFFIGVAFQDYAEGTIIVAHCLLLRILSNKINEK